MQVPSDCISHTSFGGGDGDGGGGGATPLHMVSQQSSASSCTGNSFVCSDTVLLEKCPRIGQKRLLRGTHKHYLLQERDTLRAVQGCTDRITVVATAPALEALRGKNGRTREGQVQTERTCPHQVAMLCYKQHVVCSLAANVHTKIIKTCTQHQHICSTQTVLFLILDTDFKPAARRASVQRCHRSTRL